MSKKRKKTTPKKKKDDSYGEDTNDGYRFSNKKKRGRKIKPHPFSECKWRDCPYHG